MVDSVIAWLARQLVRLRARTLPQGRSPSIDPTHAHGEIEAGRAVLVDVRERAELARGIAEPARWMPMSEFERQGATWSRFVASLPRDKRIIVYCAAGVRAGRVADALADRGFTTANLGSFRAWTLAGLPVRSGQPDIGERFEQA